MGSRNGLGDWCGACLALAVAACGGLSDPDPTVASEGTASAGGATTKPPAAVGGTDALGGRWGTAFQNAVGHSPAECNAYADAIAEKELTPGYTTLVARFDYQTLKPLGHAFFNVAASTSIGDEAAARAAAQSGFQFPGPANPAESGTLLPSGPLASHYPAWVFYQPAADFGGVVAVSSTTGLVVFAATTNWGGKGEILLPTEWNSSELGIDCASPLGDPALGFGLDLRDGTEAFFTDVAMLGLTNVVPTIWDEWGGSTNYPGVLVYSRTVGPFDPSQAEYIVILNGHTAGG